MHLPNHFDYPSDENFQVTNNLLHFSVLLRSISRQFRRSIPFTERGPFPERIKGGKSTLHFLQLTIWTMIQLRRILIIVSLASAALAVAVTSRAADTVTVIENDISKFQSLVSTSINDMANGLSTGTFSLSALLVYISS